MIRRTLLYSVGILPFFVLTSCGGAAAEGSSSVPVDISGTFLVIGFLVIVGGILLVGKLAKGSGSSSTSIKNNKPSDTALHNQPKSKPAGSSPKVQKPTRKTQSVDHIFISYRRSDSADIAGRIYDRLTGKFGRNPIFKDVDSIPLGLDFKEYLDAKVSECSVLLAIIGDRWLESNDATGKKRLDDPTDFVRIEIESALERGIPVIPLLVRGAQMPSEKNLPGSLKKLVYRNGIPIRSDPDFHRDMDRLITALEKIINPDK